MGNETQSPIRAHQNESPFGYSPRVREALQVELDRGSWYPDPTSTELRRRIAAQHGVTPEQVVVGNGVDELILLLTLCFAGDRGAVVTTASTFPGYRNAARIVRARLCTVELEPDRWAVPLQALVERATSENAALLFVCNPHNPTGTVVPGADVRHFLESDMGAGCFLPVFDEAYGEFAGEDFQSAIPFVARGARAIVLKTFSKAHGLAGFRVGYALGPVDLMARMREARGTMPFGVNRAALVAAAAAVEDSGFVETVRRSVSSLTRRFYAAMDDYRIPYVRSHANFVLVKSSLATSDAAAMLETRHGVLVRDTTDFGLPGHLRITMVAEPELGRVCRALGDVLA